MADTLNFSLVSPERELFSGEVNQVDAPGVEGEFGVLPKHAPFMTVLKPGVVRIERGQSYALQDVAQAHRDLEARRTIGSTVLIP